MRNPRITLTLGAIAVVAAVAPSAQAADVCNQARKGHTGAHDATDNDPNPPARYQTGLAPIGNVDGLAHAAGRSPALSVCSVPSTGGGITLPPPPGDIV